MPRHNFANVRETLTAEGVSYRNDGTPGGTEFTSHTPGIGRPQFAQQPCFIRFSRTSCHERRMSTSPQPGQDVFAASL
jgi:hypothetical protein